MTPDQQDLETATWDVALVDAEVKLYLLALIRTQDHQQAQQLSGLDEAGAKSARAWLRQVGVLAQDGSIDGTRLRDAKHDRLVAA